MLDKLPSTWQELKSQVQTWIRGIRGRIIFPYAVLTLLVAVLGIYVIINLTAGSLQEQIDNRLLDAARVASDIVRLHERRLLENARGLGFTEGVYEALEAGDIAQLKELIPAAASNASIPLVFVVDDDQQAVFEGRFDSDEPSYQALESMRDLSTIQLVDQVLNGGRNEYQAGLISIDGQLYFAVADPIRLSDAPVVGAMIAAEPLANLLFDLKQAAVAEVTLFDQTGQVIATTFNLEADQREKLEIEPDFFQEVVADYNRTRKISLELKRAGTVRSRPYEFAYFGFLVRDNGLVGVLSVGVEQDWVSTIALGRVQVALLFTAMLVGVVGLGYLISRRIIRPILKLVSTSRAVAQGDLTQRANLVLNDELGILADSFDKMTENLALQTRELEDLAQTLREELTRIRSILSSIADGVLVEDNQGKIVMINPAAEELLGLLAERFAELGPMREIDEQTSDNSRRFEIGGRVISTRTSPVQMPEGEILGKVMVLRDITREAEVDRLKDEFITQVSHELRTPLTAIKGYSDLLLRAMGGEVSEQQQRFLQTINKHSDTLVEMVSELLDFTQLQAGALGLRLEPMSMNDLVHGLADAWQERFEEKQIDFSVQSPSTGLQILGDERRLRWALRHLIENAHNYTKEGGQVTITVNYNSKLVTVKVIDSGVGIAPEDQKHLFSRFYRASLDRTVDVRGVGLGLYVTRAVVEAHGGDIFVKSKLGKGSTFGFSLPLDAGIVRAKAAEREPLEHLGDLLE